MTPRLHTTLPCTCLGLELTFMAWSHQGQEPQPLSARTTIDSDPQQQAKGSILAKKTAVQIPSVVALPNLCSVQFGS